MAKFLTTIDNPYDPIKQWDQWLVYDAGFCCSLVAQYSTATLDDAEKVQKEKNDEAIDLILQTFPFMYICKAIDVPDTDDRVTKADTPYYEDADPQG